MCIFCTSLRRYIGFPLDLSRLATSGLGLIPTFLSALPCCEGPSHHTPSYQQISRPRICQKNHFWSLNRNDYGFEDIQVIKLSQEQIIYFPKFRNKSLLNQFTWLSLIPNNKVFYNAATDAVWLYSSLLSPGCIWEWGSVLVRGVTMGTIASARR